MAKDSFIFYREWLPLVNTLPDASRLKFYDMLSAYHSGEIPSTGDPHLDGVVQFVFKKVEKNNLSYEKKCEKASISASMRWDANAYERTETHTNAMPSDANVKNAMLNDNDNDNVLSLSPTPSSAKPQKAPKTPRVKKAKLTRLEVEQFYKSEIDSIPLFSLEKEFAETAAARGITVELLGIGYKDFVAYMTNPSDKWPQGMWRCVLTKPDQLSLHQYSMLVLKYGMKRDEIKAYADSWENRKYDNDNLYASFTSWRDNERKRESPSGAATESSGKGLSLPKKVVQ